MQTPTLGQNQENLLGRPRDQRRHGDEETEGKVAGCTQR